MHIRNSLEMYPVPQLVAGPKVCHQTSGTLAKKIQKTLGYRGKEYRDQLYTSTEDRRDVVREFIQHFSLRIHFKKVGA